MAICLLCKYGDLSLDYCHLHKKLGVVICICNTALGELGDRWVPVSLTYWPVSLEKWTSSALLTDSVSNIEVECD